MTVIGKSHSQASRNRGRRGKSGSQPADKSGSWTSRFEYGVNEKGNPCKTGKREGRTRKVHPTGNSEDANRPLVGVTTLFSADIRGILSEEETVQWDEDEETSDSEEGGSNLQQPQ